jgi:hypothetical protein
MRIKLRQERDVYSNRDLYDAALCRSVMFDCLSEGLAPTELQMDLCPGAINISSLTGLKR